MYSLNFVRERGKKTYGHVISLLSIKTLLLLMGYLPMFTTIIFYLKKSENNYHYFELKKFFKKSIQKYMKLAKKKKEHRNYYFVCAWDVFIFLVLA